MIKIENDESMMETLVDHSNIQDKYLSKQDKGAYALASLGILIFRGCLVMGG